MVLNAPSKVRESREEGEEICRGIFLVRRKRTEQTYTKDLPLQKKGRKQGASTDLAKLRKSAIAVGKAGRGDKPSGRTTDGHHA